MENNDIEGGMQAKQFHGHDAFSLNTFARFGISF